MHFFAFAASCLATYLVSGATASPSTQSLSKRCTNSAEDRSCWGNYDLSTNYYDEVPDTGDTVEVKTLPHNHKGSQLTNVGLSRAG
jgi:hypothetical protein